MDLPEYEKLKRKADRLKAEAERAAGALEQTMARLKEEFDCDTLADAEELLAVKKREEAKAKEGYEEELGAFKEEWGERLEAV